MLIVIISRINIAWDRIRDLWTIASSYAKTDELALGSFVGEVGSRPLFEEVRTIERLALCLLVHAQLLQLVKALLASAVPGRVSGSSRVMICSSTRVEISTMVGLIKSFTVDR